MLRRFEFQIEREFHKKRLDDFLYNRFSEFGKRFLRNVLKEKKCEVNGYVVNGGLVLKENDFVEIEFDYSAQNKMFPEDISLNIVFEDSEIIVINKPARMLIHPTPRKRTGTVLNALMYYLNDDKIAPQSLRDAKNLDDSVNQNARAEIVRPGLVHRLDRETSGLVVIAKNSRALRILNSHFKRKLVEKRYLAIVEGVVNEDSGSIEAPIGRYEELRQWNVKADGKDSKTRFAVIERFADKTLLELEPVTGRTNQLRIHCAYIGHPILGDEWHGKREFPRLCLHASKLSFWHPDGGERLELECELPDEIKFSLDQKKGRISSP